MAGIKENIKKILGEIPLAAEIYWLARRPDHPSSTNYSLRNIKEILPEAVSVVSEHRKTASSGKKVFLFSSTHKWLEIDLFLSLALAGKGHEVTHGYYPYGEWEQKSDLFDVRKQSIYTWRGADPRVMPDLESELNASGDTEGGAAPAKQRDRPKDI